MALYHNIKNFLRRLAEIFYPSACARPMTKYLKSLNKKSLRGVEIGVQRGRNAYNMLRLLDIRFLYLIDPYEWYPESTETSSQHVNLNKYYNIAKRKTRKYYKNRTFIRKYSNKAIRDISSLLDFVYIDGNHDYKYVKEDIKLYYPLLKKGGIIGGHDYTASFPGVAKAVQEFADEHKLKIQGGEIDWWMVKE